MFHAEWTVFAASDRTLTDVVGKRLRSDGAFSPRQEAQEQLTIATALHHGMGPVGQRRERWWEVGWRS